MKIPEEVTEAIDYLEQKGYVAQGDLRMPEDVLPPNNKHLKAILKVTGLKQFEFEHRIAFLFRGKRSYARKKIGDVEAMLRYKNVRCLLEDMERRYKNA